MNLNFLKNLFRKKPVDWDSKEYLTKNLTLFQETKDFKLYEDDADEKERLEQELLDLINE